LGQSGARISKLKKEAISNDIPCYISESVKVETERKVKDTTDFMGNAIKGTLIAQLESFRRSQRMSPSDPLTVQDIKALEDLFYGFHSAAGSQGTLRDPVRLIEEWIISFLAEKLAEGTPITISDLAKDLVKSVLILTAGLQDSYDNLVTLEKSFVKKINIPIDPRKIKIVFDLETLGVHAPDSDHIAEATIHQLLTSEKTVFVTLDFRTILNKRDIIRTNRMVECCDPLYAFHHL
jgi:hypothetical protein